jgi:NOL1/NOP2/fmu family ribosome biogenesis protein
MLSADEILELDKKVGIELIGLYLFHKYPDNIRLSFDAISALKSQITKNILEVTDEQAEEFLKGRDILLTKEDEEKLKLKNETKGFKIIKNQDDLLGTGKLVEGRIANYMPKERRIR